MKTQTVVIALAASMLAGPSTARPQVEIGALKAGSSEHLSDVALVLSGVAGTHAARVVGPPNFRQLMQRGALRELELEVPPGPLHDAFARAHRGGRRLNSLGMRVNQGVGEPLKIEMKNVLVTGYSFHGAGSDRDKFGRVKVQFQSSPAQSSGPGAPVPGIEGSPIGTAGAPQQPPGGAPVPGIEGSPIGTAGAPSDRPRPGTVQLTVADLLPINGLQLASKLIPWGQTAAIPADQASSKQAGRCEFRYRYDTGNQGNAAAGPATNLILLNAPNGAGLAQDALPALAVAAQHTSSGTLWLKPGTWTLYVHADGKKDVAESDEQNNLRRVRVQLEGSCD